MAEQVEGPFCNKVTYLENMQHRCMQNITNIIPMKSFAIQKTADLFDDCCARSRYQG